VFQAYGSKKILSRIGYTTKICDTANVIKVAENGRKMVKKPIKTAICQLCDPNLTLATIFFSISTWQNHPIDCWWI
jgi:uncharacterized protein YlaI